MVIGDVNYKWFYKNMTEFLSGVITTARKFILMSPLCYLLYNFEV